MPESKEYSPKDVLIDALVADGDTLSGEIDVSGCTICGIHIPSGLEGTSITFKCAAESGGTFNQVDKDGSELSVTIAASRYIVLQPTDFAGMRFIKIELASQTGDITLQHAARPV